MKIRKANKKDVNIIAEIEHNSKYKNSELKKYQQTKDQTIEMIKEIFEKNSHDVYVLEEDNSSVGYFAVSFDKRKKTCYIDYIAIKKKFQGKGLARKMMKKIESIAKRKKCNEIELNVWAKNYPAISLYTKFNFHVIDIMKNFYPNKDDKLKMRKYLD